MPKSKKAKNREEREYEQYCAERRLQAQLWETQGVQQQQAQHRETRRSLPERTVSVDESYCRFQLSRLAAMGLAAKRSLAAKGRLDALVKKHQTFIRSLPSPQWPRIGDSTTEILRDKLAT